ncbi:hypothetical protein [Martelella mediterranea]|uniref:hypothetical protein n=1 Tax=Martelella mediterranea TaxID=293089 RepID=UPI001404901A|nr:hypothetical protein [Martelella mediterranea]
MTNRSFRDEKCAAPARSRNSFARFARGIEGFIGDFNENRAEARRRCPNAPR